MYSWVLQLCEPTNCFFLRLPVLLSSYFFFISQVGFIPQFRLFILYNKNIPNWYIIKQKSLGSAESKVKINIFRPFSFSSFFIGLDFLGMLISFLITVRFLQHSWERWPSAAPAYVVQSIFSVSSAEIFLRKCPLGFSGRKFIPEAIIMARDFLIYKQDQVLFSPACSQKS